MKIAKFISNCLAVIGVFIIIGTAGTSDYMSEIQQYYSLQDMLHQVLIGVILVGPTIIVHYIDDNYVIGCRKHK